MKIQVKFNEAKFELDPDKQVWESASEEAKEEYILHHIQNYVHDNLESLIKSIKIK